MGSPRGFHSKGGAADSTLSLWSLIPCPFFRGSVTGPVPESRAPHRVSTEQDACEKALKSSLPAGRDPNCLMEGPDAGLEEAHVWVHSDPILLGDESVLPILLCVDPLF